MSPQRILFLAEGQLGDLLLLTPALRATKESFPQNHLSVLVVERHSSDDAKHDRFNNLQASAREREASVLSTNTNVDELLVLSRQALRSASGVQKLRAEVAIVRFLRERKYDIVVCTFPEDRFAGWAFASGASIRVGQRNQGLQRLLNRRPDIQRSDRGVLEYYCDLVRVFGTRVDTPHTEYVIPQSSIEWADTTLRAAGIGDGNDIVTIHPGASGDYKIWPPERYAELSNHLSATNVKVVLLHGPRDEPVMQAIRPKLRAKVIEVRTGNSVGNLAAVIRRSRLCISNDSGPRHLAIAVGTPSLAFFRQHHDKEWGVYAESEQCVVLKGTEECPVCPADVCHDEIPEGQQFASHCLRMVAVDAALARAEKMLSS